MAYIGKQPVVGNFQVCDAISVVNGQAAYTMQVASANVEPENANHMLVSLNGVLQKPGSSFTISGATITFASNLATGDVIDFIILLGDTLNVGTPSDDTVGAAQVKNDLISGLTALTSAPADTDELLISDAGTLKRIDVSLVGGDNTPSFRATMSADQDNISSGTNQKVTFNTETYDEGSCYDHSSNYRFTVPSGEGGKYLLIAHLHFRANADYQQKTVRLYKNGSFLAETQHYTTGEFTESSVTQNCEIVTIENLSASDYIEVYAKSQGQTFHIKQEGSYFSACKLII